MKCIAFQDRWTESTNSKSVSLSSVLVGTRLIERVVAQLVDGSIGLELDCFESFESPFMQSNDRKCFDKRLKDGGYDIKWISTKLHTDELIGGLRRNSGLALLLLLLLLSTLFEFCISTSSFFSKTLFSFNNNSLWTLLLDSSFSKLKWWIKVCLFRSTFLCGEAVSFFGDRSGVITEILGGGVFSCNGLLKKNESKIFISQQLVEIENKINTLVCGIFQVKRDASMIIWYWERMELTK